MSPLPVHWSLAVNPAPTVSEDWEDREVSTEASEGLGLIRTREIQATGRVVVALERRALLTRVAAAAAVF
jgi:hypothetical protein